MTVITFDLALYEKAVQLVDTRTDLKGKVLPRLGELQVVVAAPRALGSSTENFGIDDAWIEADIYRSAATRQILQGTHYKRSLSAHICLYMSLYELAVEQFFDHNPNLKNACHEAAAEIELACSVVMRRPKADSVKQANASLLQTLFQQNVAKRLQEWEEQKSEEAMFRSLMNYLHRVETILYFIRASRDADLHLHLEAGEALSKLFFAMDRIKYKSLWPRYIADMHTLKTDHPKTRRELEEGNISVTKSYILIVSIGADHACQHLDKLMKVHSGLTGISNNPSARQGFFLAAPELPSLPKEFKD